MPPVRCRSISNLRAAIDQQHPSRRCCTQAVLEPRAPLHGRDPRHPRLQSRLPDPLPRVQRVRPRRRKELWHERRPLLDWSLTGAGSDPSLSRDRACKLIVACGAAPSILPHPHRPAPLSARRDAADLPSQFADVPGSGLEGYTCQQFPSPVRDTFERSAVLQRSLCLHMQGLPVCCTTRNKGVVCRR